MANTEPTRRSIHYGSFTTKIEGPAIDYPYTVGAISETLRGTLEIIEELRISELLETVSGLEDEGDELELERISLEASYSGERLTAAVERAARVLRDYDEEREAVLAARAERLRLKTARRKREAEEMLGPNTTTDPDVAEMLGAKLIEGGDDAGE